MTIDEVAHPLPISHGSAYETIHNRLAYHKVRAQWAPKQLKELHKQKRLNIFKLDRYGVEGNNFLERIVTGDETRIHHYEPASECQNMEWKHPHLPARRKLKTHPTARMLTLIVFGTQRATAGTLSRQRSTVHSARYSGMLRDKLYKLKPAIRSER